jgi:DNA-binding HxlR family transcriptional regulator
LVVREALRGVVRFDDFQSSLGVAKNVLADRLDRLCAEGILERFQYQARPARHGYRPTTRGYELWPVLTAMMRWGDTYYAPNGAPRVAAHASCGGELHLGVRCPQCERDVDVTEITTLPGPGSRQRARR